MCLTRKRARSCQVPSPRSPRRPIIATHPQLRAIVGEKLTHWWGSPQQIAGWLKPTYPEVPEMQVSQETIFRTLFIQSRGALRRQLTAHLPTRRVIRRPAGTRLPDGRRRSAGRPAHPRATAATIGKPDALRAADHPAGAQVGREFPAQRTTRLHVQGAIDAFGGTRASPGPGGRSASASQRSVAVTIGVGASRPRCQPASGCWQLARLGPRCVRPSLSVRCGRSIAAATTVAGHFAAHRRRRPV